MRPSGPTPVSRRSVLRSAAGVVLLGAAGVLAGCGASVDQRLEEAYAAAPETAVGDFRLRFALYDDAPALRVTHVAEPGRVLWESEPGRGWLAGGSARAVIAENTTPASGFGFSDVDVVRLDQQKVEAVGPGPGGLVVRGTVSGPRERRSQYTVTFTEAQPGHLRLEASLDPGWNRVVLRHRSDPDERFFGFGQQLTYGDQKGRRLPVLVQEHGVGRGLPLITEAVALRYGPRTAGNWSTTEVSVPHYLTTRNRSLFLENSEYCEFDLREPQRVEVTLHAPTMTARILHGADPLALVESYTAYTGRMRPLPDWLHEGAVVAVQGGTDRARARLDALVAADVPLAALWIQDWVGERTTPAGRQLWWDWQLDTTLYPGWPALLGELAARRGARMLVYVNPFLADQPGHDQLYREALANGYLVRSASGAPVAIPNAGFSAGLVDLSNPAARSWIKGILTQRLIAGAGASGWMADFGEALPFDAVLFSGEDPAAWHNRYPEEWARVNREAIEESGRGDELVCFHRSGFTRSPGYATLFWTGDQLQSWDVHDGIRSALTGMLSGGFSGFGLVHSDTGGFDSISLPLPGGRSDAIIRRSRELLARWSELSALTPVLRTHEGIDPAVAWQVDSDPDTLAHFARCARLYRAWAPLRRALVAQTAASGHPVMRHLALHHPQDPRTHEITDQYLLGPDVLVAPVLDDGARSRRVYLPDGTWTSLWSGESIAAPGGRWTEVPGPLGEPPVFLRAGSPAADGVRAGVAAAGLLAPAPAGG